MNTNKLFLAIAGLITLCYTSCTNLDDINNDPNLVTTLDADLMLTSVEFLPGTNSNTQYRNFIYPGGWLNQWTGSWAVTEYGGVGQYNQSYSERLWFSSYPEVIKNVIDLIENTKDNPEKVNVNSIAKVLKVYNFQRLTDVYGDIPYSEAGKGYTDNILTPKYDTQEFIYEDFFKELKEAVNNLDETQKVPSSDLFYNGNIEKWKKFANSLRLRVAMRLIKVNPEKAKAEFESAVRDGVFTSNDDIAFIKYDNVQNAGNGTGQGNGVSNYLYGINSANGSQSWLTTDIAEVMEEMQDPRLLKRYYAYVAYTDPNRTDITNTVFAIRKSYAAMTVEAQKFSHDENVKYNVSGSLKLPINGKEQTVSLAYTRLRPSKYLMAFDAPYIYMGYAEVEFLLAEAAFRNWDVPGTASEHYAKGLAAAINQMNLFGAPVTTQEVTDFVASNPLTSGQELNGINTQLWILHIIDPLEAWANYRRSGYPDIKFYNRYPTKNASNGVAPRRLPYPIDEQSKNEENYRAAAARIKGGDTWTSRVWWDKE